nr:putative O-glycosylation ligase, exosortase A system-associated [uncultured Rhodopila sp.]
MRSVWLLSLYLAFIVMGASAPFVTTLGYVWVDTFRPQEVAYLILNQIPVALIMGIAAVGSYMVLDRRSPPRFSLETGLVVLMALWVTLTLTWAEVPDAAWGKWSTVFKTLIFAAFVPYVIRSRIQIEAFAQTYVLSLAANFIPFGIKTMISGGGYGSNLGLQQGNSGLSEGGLLSTVCLMAVPLAIYLSNYSLLIPRLKLSGWGYRGIAGLAIMTAIGTYERSALIGLIALGAIMWVRSKNKFVFGLAGLVVAGAVAFTTSSAWNQRISTIGSFQTENSAYVRILVWKWTLDYTSRNPLGGGFQAYLIDHVDVPGTAESPGFTQFGRAFHSIYFEVLGEHGYPGLFMFLLIAGSMLVKLHRLSKKASAYPELDWVVSLSGALQGGLAVFLTAGAFVGIAFQPMFWYFVAMGISLNAYMWRVEHPHTGVLPGWRLPERPREAELPRPSGSGLRAGNLKPDWADGLRPR